MHRLQRAASVPEAIELESHFILRLPVEDAHKLHNIIEESATSEDDRSRLFINFDQDKHALVKLDSKLFKGKLVDLPCIIETQKTFDKKNFYKVANLSQMLVCEPDDGVPVNVEEEKKDETKYLWPHGITPPLRHVRRRRFRKTIRKKQAEVPDDLERELKRLLRADCEAVDVRWEVTTATRAGGDGAPSTSAAPASVAHLLKEDDLFGKLSSSESEDEGGDEGELDEAGRSAVASMVDAIHMMAPVPMAGCDEMGEGPSGQSLEEMGMFDDDGQVEDSLRSQVLDTQSSLARVQQQKRGQENVIRTVDNPTLKLRLEGELASLADEEMRLLAKLDELESSLSALSGGGAEDLMAATSVGDDDR